MDLATIIVLILAVIVFIPIYLVVRTLHRTMKHKRDTSRKTKLDDAVVEELMSRMRATGFKRIHARATGLDSKRLQFERREADGGRTQVDFRYFNRGQVPEYNVTVCRLDHVSFPLHKNTSKWEPTLTSRRIDLEPLDNMIATAEQAAR